MNKFQKLIRRFREKNTDKQASGKRGRKGLRHRKRKPLTKKAKIWISVGCTLGVLLIAGIITGVVWFQQNFSYDYNPISKNPENLGYVEPPEGSEGIVNIALFGVDSRDHDYSGLSDSIMIISVNCDTGSVKLVSVMRDSLVKVEGHGYQKINAAYNLGGPELAIKTLNQTFQLNILNYATVDFFGMAEIIDVVGGVEVELTKSEVYYVNGGVDESAKELGTERTYVSKSGVQTLNGVQAVSYARIRKVPTVNGTRDDYGRTERQRLVMNQLFQKALTLPVTQYPTLIKTMLPYIETSMGYDDILKLAGILKADSVTMQQNRIPMDDAVISGGLNVPYIGSCVYYDLEFAADLLNAFFFEDITFEDYVAANGIRKNNWYGSTGSSGSSTGGSSGVSSNTQSSGSATTTDTPSSSSSSTDSSNSTSNNPSSSGSGSSNVTTDTGTNSTDTNTSVSTSPPILPSTSTSTSTSTSASDTTDTGTSSEPEDTGTATESTSTSSGSSSTSDTSVSSNSSETSDTSDAGSSDSDTTDTGSSDSDVSDTESSDSDTSDSGSSDPEDENE